MQQHSMVILADVKPDELLALNQTLNQIGELLKINQTVLFHNTKTVHYAAWLVLPSYNDQNGKVAPSRLVLETNYDGELDAHLDDLITECGTAFDQVYSHCVGYPTGGCADRKSAMAYLKGLDTRTSLRPTAYYVALPGRTLEDVRNAIYVYEESRRFVDANARGRDSQTVRDDLLWYFRQNVSRQSWPRRFSVTQKGLGRLLAFNLIPGIPFMLAYLLVVWVPLMLLAGLWFEKREQYELQQGQVTDPTWHKECFTNLDLGLQNHLCTFATMKPGSFRLLVVKRALALGQILASKFFILGRLDQMNTVHFLRWILLDRELLFVGNYDGNYSGYLTDFSDQAWGVNLIWSNTFGFPPTKFLWREGASDLDGFQTHALTHYTPAPVFYSAYPKYSLRNLVRILEFRDQLADEIQ